MTFQTNKNHPANRDDLSQSAVWQQLCTLWLGVRDSNRLGTRCEFCYSVWIMISFGYLQSVT